MFMLILGIVLIVGAGLFLLKGEAGFKLLSFHLGTKSRKAEANTARPHLQSSEPNTSFSTKPSEQTSQSSMPSPFPPAPEKMTPLETELNQTTSQISSMQASSKPIHAEKNTAMSSLQPGMSKHSTEAASGNMNFNLSPKSRLIALLVCFFLGGMGIHRFYVGKGRLGFVTLLICIVGIGSVFWGQAQLIAVPFIVLGALSIWALVDLILIAIGKYQDGDRRIIQNWT